MQGMKELELQPELTDVFLSHVHSDHTGNAGALYEMGCRIIMGETDNKIMYGARWAERLPLFRREGMPESIVEEVTRNNPGLLFAPKIFDTIAVNDGDILYYGGYELRCIHTPGHTPGHICLYDKTAKLIFLGDHVLFDISPNICVWSGFFDPVGTYMNSLEKIMDLDAAVCLPSHRTRGEISMKERAQGLIAHHERRLAETLRLIGEYPGISAYELAGKMSWRIRARSWEDFPAAQKNFALLETLAHIEYFLARDKVLRVSDDAGRNTYKMK